MEVTCPLSHLKSSSVRQWPWAGWLQLHPLHQPELGITQQVALSLPGTLSLTLHLFVSLVMTEMSSCRCARVWPLWTKQLDSHLIPPCFNFPTWSLCKICYRLVICFLDFFFLSYYFWHNLNDWDYRYVLPYPVSTVFETSRSLLPARQASTSWAPFPYYWRLSVQAAAPWANSSGSCMCWDMDPPLVHAWAHSSTWQTPVSDWAFTLPLPHTEGSRERVLVKSAEGQILMSSPTGCGGRGGLPDALH